MHKQTDVKIKVDEGIAPLIQWIIDNLPGIVPIASCQGGNQDLNESSDAYIFFISRDQEHLHKLMRICQVHFCDYWAPDPQTGNIPTWRISIENLDEVIKSLNVI